MSSGKNLRATYAKGVQQMLIQPKDDLLEVIPIFPLVARLVFILELKISLGVVLRFKLLIPE